MWNCAPPRKGSERPRWRRWRRSAPVWTASPWPSSLPPPGAGRSRRPRSQRGWKATSGSSPEGVGGPWPASRPSDAPIDWSYALLSDQERLLLRRLSAFAGGFTLHAAEMVGAGEPLEDWEVTERLTGLMERSLVQEEVRAGEPRYPADEALRWAVAALRSQ